MKLENPDLSIIIPAYNCAGFIGKNLLDLHDYLTRNGGTFEILVVNDGSTDGTAEAVSAVARTGIRLIHSAANLGKFGALALGMREATGKCRVFTDADLPYDLEAISYIKKQILERKLHLVVGDRTLAGSRYNELLPASRQVANRLFSFLVRLIVTGGLFDTQCGVKGFRSDVAAALFEVLRDNSFSGDVELLYVALKYNLEIKRIPVRLRQSSPSSYPLISTAAGMFFKILRLRNNWEAGYYTSEKLREISNQFYWEHERGS